MTSKIKKLTVGLLILSFFGIVYGLKGSEGLLAVGTDEKNQEEITSRSLATSNESMETVSLKETRNLTALLDRKKLLESQGWVEKDVNEPAYITVGKDQLRYYFGSPDDIGQDEAGVVHGKPLSEGTNHLKIPNVDYVDRTEENGKTTEKIMQHLFMYPNTPWTTIRGFFTSQGLIVASKNSSGVRQSSIMYNTGSDFKLFEKTVNGLTAKKLVYIAKYHDTKYNPELLVETTMTGLPIGRVKIDQAVTNIANRTYEQFMLGYSEDTKLGTEDNVFAMSLGNNRGFYLNYEDPLDKKVYRLTYFVSEKDYPGLKPMDNWRGGHWTKYDDTRPFIAGEDGGWDGEETFFHDDTDPLHLRDFGAFKDIDSTGDETHNFPADIPIQSYKYDTAISYKNQPITLEPTKTSSFSWLLGMDLEYDGPEIKFDKIKTVVNRDTKFEITGNWRDLNSQNVSLSYSLDGGERQSFAKDLANPDLNKWTPFKLSLDSTKWTPGSHELMVYGKNHEGKEAAPQKMTIEVTSRLLVRYQGLAGEVLTPPTGAVTMIEGAEKTLFSFDLADLLPLYDYHSVSIGQKVNNKIEGIFPEKDGEIVIYYKAIPQNVTMTVNYYLEGTTTPVKDIETDNQPIASLKQSVPIGALLKPYAEAVKKEFTGYRFVNVSDSGQVPNQDFAVNLYYQGKLALEKVPTRLFFETAKLISIGSQKLSLEQDITVDILDTLENKGAWTVQLRLKDTLKTESNVEFKGKLKFLTSKDDLTLSDMNQTIFSKEVSKLGYESISWNRHKEGLYLQQAPGNLAESYVGSLEWTLTDGK